MIRTIDSHVVKGNVRYMEYAGLSTDTKPTGSNIATGSLFHEVDTTKVYAYNESAATGEEWVEQITLGGDS